MRDRLDELFVDEDFDDWFPVDGRRGLSPARLALLSVLQYVENLTDRQAAEPVRCRLDWKYCLGMDLDDAGFDYAVLSELRARMTEGDRADRLPAVMVDHLVAAGLVKRRGSVQTDSTHVLAAVRTMYRTELVTESLRAALEQLALAGQEWLTPLIEPGWIDRYGLPALYHRLPKGKAIRISCPWGRAESKFGAGKRDRIRHRTWRTESVAPSAAAKSSGEDHGGVGVAKKTVRASRRRDVGCREVYSGRTALSANIE